MTVVLDDQRKVTTLPLSANYAYGTCAGYNPVFAISSQQKAASQCQPYKYMPKLRQNIPDLNGHVDSPKDLIRLQHMPLHYACVVNRFTKDNWCRRYLHGWRSRGETISLAYMKDKKRDLSI